MISFHLRKNTRHCYTREMNVVQIQLLLYTRAKNTYSEKTGPFQPVRLLIFADGSWRFQCTIYGFQELAKGQLNSTDSADLIALASRWFSSSHTLSWTDWLRRCRNQARLRSKNSEMHGRSHQKRSCS